MADDSYGYFAHYTNAELIHLLNSEGKDSVVAIEILTELNSRDLSPTELEKIKNGLKDSNGNKRLDQKIKKTSNRFLQSINPFNKMGADRDISMICTSICFYILYTLITSDEVSQTITHFVPGSAGSLLLLSFLIVLVFIYYFYRRKKIGWIIVCAWAVYSFIRVIPSEFNFIFKKQLPNGVDSTWLLLQLLIFLSFIYTVNKAPVRRAFGVSILWQIASIAIAVAIGIYSLKV